MSRDFPGYHEFQRKGELIQFMTRQDGCLIFSVQKFHEAWERRAHPELYETPFEEIWKNRKEKLKGSSPKTSPKGQNRRA